MYFVFIVSVNSAISFVSDVSKIPNDAFNVSQIMSISPSPLLNHH